ncbi:MAG TPA: TIGR01212 family radical SAM protein [bacterium]|nr:TIGR01212 family radical SAM protein [bacterium]
MTLIRFSKYLRDRFFERVQRIPLHAGFTCPNRDGLLGVDGCIFCDNASFNSAVLQKTSIEQQMIQGMEWAWRRYGANKYLAYFQTYSNTYGSLNVIKSRYMEALKFPGVVGLMIGTRPDCLTPEIVNWLCELSSRWMIWIELGVQSCHDETLHRINRGHSWRDVELAVDMIRGQVQELNDENSVKLAAHVILGLPGETREMILQTADSLRRLSFDGIKLHHLHAVKGTRLAEMFMSGQWQPLSVREYVSLAAAFLTRLPDPCVVMRLVGDCPEKYLIAPHWELKKAHIEAAIWAEYERMVKQ